MLRVRLCLCLESADVEQIAVEAVIHSNGVLYCDSMPFIGLTIAAGYKTTERTDIAGNIMRKLTLAMTVDVDNFIEVD